MSPRSQWLLKVVLSILGLMRLLYTGAQRGWIG
jgi:hypothetical protein